MCTVANTIRYDGLVGDAGVVCGRLRDLFGVVALGERDGMVQVVSELG